MFSSATARPSRKAKDDANLRMEQDAAPLTGHHASASLGHRSMDIGHPPLPHASHTRNFNGDTSSHSRIHAGLPGSGLGQVDDEESTLYGAIKSGRVAPQTLVDDWIEQYKMQRDQALLELMQFFISCSGCHGRLSANLLQRRQYPEMIHKMTDEFLEDSAEYPLIQTGPAWRKFRASFVDFIHILIQRCQYSIIYDGYMMDQLIAFLVGLTDSQVRAFRHTSTLASMKMVTALVTVALNLGINRDNTQRQYDAEKQKSQARRANERLESLVKRREELDNHVHLVHNMILALFRGVFVHRYRDSNPEIRSICIQELGVCLLSYPSMMLDDTYLKYVGWTLYDRVGEVRLQCLRALQPVYENPNLVSSMELFTSRFKGRLVDMTLDKEQDVAVQAVKLLTLILRHNESALEDKDCENIYELVFCMPKPLAVAAGEFISHKLFQTDPNAVPTKTKRGKKRSVNTPKIRDLIQFFIESELHEHSAYLVDSLWDFCPMLRDWEGMLDLLLEEPDRNESTLSHLEEAKLIDILVSCIRQAVTGESPIGRGAGSGNVGSATASAKLVTATAAAVNEANTGTASGSKASNSATTQREQRALAEAKQRVTENLLVCLPTLLMRFGASRSLIVTLLEIPLYMDLDLYAAARQERTLDQLLKYLQDCVVRHTDSDILQACTRVYEAMCEENLNIREKCQTARDTLLDTIIENFKETVNALFGQDTLLPDVSEEDEFTLVSALKRISGFYACHDLTNWDLWSHLIRLCQLASVRSEVLSQFQTEIVCMAIDCCADALMWCLYRLDETQPSTAEIEAVSKMLTQFMCLCTSYLDHANVPIAQVSYRVICDLLVVFSQRLGERSKAFTPLAYEADKDLEMGLVQFMEHHVFVTDDKKDENENIAELHSRRKLLASFCKLIVNCILPIQAAATAYKHYIRFYNDFGDIMKTTLGRARETCRVSTARMIVRCLQLVYADLEAEQAGSVDRTSDGFNALKELTRRFNLSFGLDIVKNRHAIVTLHLEGIHFCKQSQINQTFVGAVPPDETGQSMQPPSNLVFLEALSEFSNKLLKQDRKLLCDYVNKTFPNATGQAWSSLVSYRATLDPESMEHATASSNPTSEHPSLAQPASSHVHKPRGRPPKRLRESISTSATSAPPPPPETAPIIANRTPTVIQNSDTRIIISLRPTTATAASSDVTSNENPSGGGGHNSVPPSADSSQPPGESPVVKRKRIVTITTPISPNNNGSDTAANVNHRDHSLLSTENVPGSTPKSPRYSRRNRQNQNTLESSLQPPKQQQLTATSSGSNTAVV